MIATVGHASWDLGSGQENEICFAALVDPGPDGQPPAASSEAMCTWAARSDLATFEDLSPRAPVACRFSASALDAAGAP